MVDFFHVLQILPAIPFLIFSINLYTWRRTRKENFDNKQRAVSVLIPARNEEKNIADCVRSVYASSYPLHEIIVYNDQSTDHTQRILENLQQEIPNLSIQQGFPLPAGWVGKNHACHQLATLATGDIFLFIDADTRLYPQGIETLIETLEDSFYPSELLSCLPRQIQRSWGEKLLLPLLHLTFLAWLPLRLVRRSKFPSMTAAIGQIVMIRASAYRSLGGFSTIPSSLIDDVALAKLYKKNDYTVNFIDGHNIAACRMYHSFSEIWNGFTKNIYVGLGSSIPRLITILSLYFCCFILPFLLIGLLPFVELSTTTIGLAILGVLCNLLIRFALAWRYEQSQLSSLFQPLAVTILILIALQSWFQSIFTQISWKGRVYPSSKSSTVHH